MNTQKHIDTMKQCGAQASKNPEFLDHFCYSFGENILSDKKIAQRMDFLQDNRTNSLIKDVVTMGYFDDVSYLRDESGNFRYLSIVLLNNSEDGSVYSIREYRRHPVEVCGFTIKDHGQDYHHVPNNGSTSTFWNFDKNHAICKPSDAFLDLPSTRAAVNMIVWTSNVLGFQGNKKSP